MAWTTPRTWTTGELVTASIMNTHVRDNLSYIKDAPTFDGSVTVTGTLSGSSVVLTGTLNMAASQQLYFGAGNDTYIIETSANLLQVVTGGSTVCQIGNGIVRMMGAAGAHQASSAAIDASGSTSRWWSWGADNSTLGSFEWATRSANGSLGGTIMTLSSAGVLSVPNVGTHTFGGGGTAAASAININGGSGNNIGAYIALAKNGTIKTYVGHESVILAAGTTDATAIYATDVIRFFTNSGSLAKWGINTNGDFTVGNSNHLALSAGTPTCGGGGANCSSVSGTDYAMKATGVAGNHLIFEISFGHTWSTAPICVVTGSDATVAGAPITIGSVTTTTLVLHYQANVNTETLYITCMGY